MKLLPLLYILAAIVMLYTAWQRITEREHYLGAAFNVVFGVFLIARGLHFWQKSAIKTPS